MYFSVGGSFWLLYIIFLFVRLFVFVKKKSFFFCYVFVCLFVFCFFLDIFRNIFLAYYWSDEFFNVYIGRSVALIHFEFFFLIFKLIFRCLGFHVRFCCCGCGCGCGVSSYTSYTGQLGFVGDSFRRHSRRWLRQALL